MNFDYYFIGIGLGDDREGKGAPPIMICDTTKKPMLSFFRD